MRAFWGRRNVTDLKTMPAIYVAAGQAPRGIAPRYFGQSWSGSDYYSEHYGILFNTVLAGNWNMRAGIFRSIYDVPRNYADLYLNTSSRGIASHTFIGEPEQYSESTSGEVQFSHSMSGKSWRQELVLARFSSLGIVTRQGLTRTRQSSWGEAGWRWWSTRAPRTSSKS